MVKKGRKEQITHIINELYKAVGITIEAL